MRTIDINCDLGEGLANESALMPLISSCNIACGAHAGSIKIIDETIKIAQKHKVKIGAHPSFPDRENFGRKNLEMTENELQESIESQLNIFKERADLLQEKVHHIKAHGALYNSIAKNNITAKIFVNAVKNSIDDVFLYVPYQSEIEKIALANKLKIKYEVFIDRNYNSDLTLVNRQEKNALITDFSQAFKQLYSMLTKQKVTTVNGLEVFIKADTFCVHGDHPKVKELLKHIAKLLTEKGIKII